MKKQPKQKASPQIQVSKPNYRSDQHLAWAVLSGDKGRLLRDGSGRTLLFNELGHAAETAGTYGGMVSRVHVTVVWGSDAEKV